MLETIKNYIEAIENELVYLEESDLAHTKCYAKLRKQRKALKTAAKRLERIGK